MQRTSRTVIATVSVSDSSVGPESKFDQYLEVVDVATWSVR